VIDRDSTPEQQFLLVVTSTVSLSEVAIHPMELPVVQNGSIIIDEEEIAMGAVHLRAVPQSIHHPLKRSRQNDIIGVHMHEEPSLAASEDLVVTGGDASVSGVLQQADAAVLKSLGNRVGVVLGTIIDDEQLEIDAFLPQDTFDGLFDVFLAVEGRHGYSQLGHGVPLLPFGPRRCPTCSVRFDPV
jgi:hypothetical protein